MSELEKLYYDPAHYAGFSAVENLTRAAKPNFTRNNVARWLESQDAYSLHRPLRRKFPRLHYNVTNIDDVWEGDLIEVRNLKSYNDGYSYILMIIDVLSKFVWVEPLRDKTSICVTKAFQRVLARSKGRIPIYLQTDKGKEFVGRATQKFLEENDIRFRDIVRAYNHTRHSVTKMQPTVVTRENARIARENITRRWKDVNKIKNAKYHAGDLVRVSRAKGTFEKEYEANWTEEIFRIHRVLEWRKPRVYELSDLMGEVIDGIFYEQELARIEKNLQEEEYIVDRVIRSKGRGANRQLLVSWRGYPSKFDSWIPASSLSNLRDDGNGPISHDSSKQ
ncbi:uncharacterized protein LOC105199763 [Solenopsis invicta]|uniref:uncharacterized protein LOC105199763 n=1 Tax=Solenopsis invicta TaxID=13686 RepID=UPI00193D4F4E|nr:uncharacterized protein LOC105199763 [Solenopsis invicta]